MSRPWGTILAGLQRRDVQQGLSASVLSFCLSSFTLTSLYCRAFVSNAEPFYCRLTQAAYNNFG